MGSAKKNTKKSTKPPNKKGTTVTTTVKAGKKKNGATKSKNPLDNIPDYVEVPNAEEDNVDISDEDLEFFAANQDFGKFLKSMDSRALTKNDKKKKTLATAEKRKQRSTQQQSIPDPTTAELTSSDEDDYNDDDLEDFNQSDLESLNEDDLPSINGGSDDDMIASDDEDEDDEEDLLGELDDEDDDDLMDLDEELEKQQPAKKKRKQEGPNESEEEMDYELKPRKVAGEWTKKDYHSRLPIKLPGGKVTQVQPDFSDEEKSDEEEQIEQVEEEEEEEEVDESETLVPEEPERKLTKKEYLLSKKEELARTASTIQEDPEANAGLLKKLRSVAKDDNMTVKKLALLTQLAVYKDIIPGYRIRPLTEKEEAVKVSKDVKKLREFEKTLLSNYESYIKDLDFILKDRKGQQQDPSLVLVATRCLCELLTTKTHFNFRLNLMVAVVSRMSTVNWNEVADMCCKAIISVFENDESGRTSLDAVTMITRMIKSKNYAVHENVINSFLHLRLRDELAPASSRENDDQRGKKRKKQFLNKKARKALKETKEIEKEFKEAEAVVSKEEKEKTHTETLKLLFAFYFRVLKKQSQSLLLPAVLQGLAKFAHLISVDFFDDLLNALKAVLESLDHKSSGGTAGAGTRKRLLCIITAFELLSGQGEALNYDLKSYYSELYGILYEAAFHYMVEDKPSSEHLSESEMLTRGLELMFLKKRQVPMNRMAAFIKRFSVVALNMPSKTVMNCLQLVKRLINKDRRLDALIQSEDRAASGIYMPYLQDPDLCNPFGTSLYELFLYKDHYDPAVRALAQSIQQPPESA